MAEEENNNVGNQSVDEALQQALSAKQQLEDLKQSVLHTGVVGPGQVFPSIYKERQDRLAETAEFVKQKNFDYTDFFDYMTRNEVTKEGKMASSYFLTDEKLSSQFASYSRMFEQRGYDIDDCNFIINSVSATEEDRQLLADYIKLMGGDMSDPKYKDFYDMINTAKNFTTLENRYHHQDNSEVSFIIDSGTTNSGLSRYWYPQLEGMGIKYELTPDGYGKASISTDRLASAPYFAYAFIESFNNDYSDANKKYDEVAGNDNRNKDFTDSRFHRWGNRNQLISINNITNDRDGGTFSLWSRLDDVIIDTLWKNTPFNDWGSGSFLGQLIGMKDESHGYQGYKEYRKLKETSGLSRKALNERLGITEEEYYKQRKDLAYKYDDGKIIDIMTPVHNTIKQAIERLGLPQIEVASSTTLPQGTLEEGALDEAIMNDAEKSAQLKPLYGNIDKIPYLLAKAMQNGKLIGFHSKKTSPTEVYESLDPAKYKDVQDALEYALTHNKNTVTMSTEVISSGSEKNDLVYITLDFDAKLDDVKSKTLRYLNDQQIWVNKEGYDRYSVRFPASLIGGMETDAANSPVNKYRAQLEYMKTNGGQITLLNDIVPESLPIRLEFDADQIVKLKFGRNKVELIDDQIRETPNNKEYQINTQDFDKLAEAMHFMKGLKSSLYMARYLKQAYGEQDELFLKAKDDFETQLGDAITRLTMALYSKELLNNPELIGNYNIDVLYELGLMDEDGNFADFYNIKRTLAVDYYRRKQKNKQN